MTGRERIALVTGAGRGIGRSIALHLAADGCAVAATARTLDELSSLVAEIEAAGGKAIAVTGDLSDRAEPKRVIDEVNERLGPINVLVNNAGIGSSQGPQPVSEFDETFWDLTFEVNLHAPFLLTKLCLPAMLAAGWGRVITIASINSKVPAFHGAAYTASKHGVAGLMTATAHELGASGVTANSICPGVTATVLNDKRIAYDAERLGISLDEIEESASPLGRRLVPDEIAGLAVFLAGDGSAAINGQSINVCGGRQIS